MPKWKLARGKKKEKAPKGGMIGCIGAIVIFLAFFIWMFFAALQPK
jgi:hypothetical protein